MSRRRLALALAVAVQSAPLHAQPAAPDTVDRLLADAMVRMRIPGLSLAVVRGGKLIRAQGYGVADLEHEIPVTPQTVFKIGSVSKQFLATGIVLLAQDGRLTVDDPVGTHISAAPESWRGITLRHFLTHTSGVLREGPAFDPAKVQPDSIVVRSAFAQPLVFPTGSKYQYCNVCYFTLADVIARVSGKPWDVFLAERVFRPSGMTATRTTTTTELVAHRARGYTWRNSGYVNAPEFLALRPSGAFLSTVLDLAKWDAMLYEDRVLTTSSRAAMWTPVRLTGGGSYGYGFGWTIDSVDGHWRVHHGGSLPGFRAEMARFPDDSLTVIVLTNADGAQPEVIARDVARTYLSAAARGASRGSARGGVSDADLAITHVAVVDVVRGRVVPDQDVLLKGDRILSVTPSSRATLPSTVRVIDGTRKYVMPGLWDMHVHLTVSGRPAQVEMPLFVAHGVTGVRVMGADRPSATPNRTAGLDHHRALQAQIAAGTLTGPRLLALASWAVNGAAGITDSMPGFFKARTQDEGRQLARYFRERGFDFIKIYNNVSREGYLGLAEEARSLNLPFAGHEPGSLSAIELSNAGQKSIEHSRVFLFNCFAGADSMQKGLLREVGATTLRRRMVDEFDAKRCSELFRTFARNGTYITPTHVTRRMDAFAGDSSYRHDARMKYIPLSQQMAWLEDAKGMVASDSSAAGRRSYMDFYRKGLSLTNDAYRAGVPVMLGTDAGDSFVFPGASVHDELGEFVKAGLTPAEALRTATLGGATYLGRAADFGTVQAGRFADLVLLDGNPLEDIGNSRRIHTVVLNGRVFGRAALDSLLAGVEVAVRPDAQTKLWAASISGDTVAIALALTEGARIDSLDAQRNRRALNYAAINNRSAAVRLLIARGATLNLANRTGFTPVHHAAESGALDALTILIGAGADITIASSQGRRPLDTAQARGDQAAIRLLEAAAKRP